MLHFWLIFEEDNSISNNLVVPELSDIKKTSRDPAEHLKCTERLEKFRRWRITQRGAKKKSTGLQVGSLMKGLVNSLDPREPQACFQVCE